jgi:transposase
MSTDALPLPELSELPDDPQLLRTLVLQLLEALRGERAQREQLEHRLDLVLRKLYGRSSEKVDPNQLPLFDSSLQAPAARPPVAEANEQPQPRGGHGRRPKPDHFRRVDVVHDLSDAEKASLAGPGQLVLIGEEVTEQYDWQPSSLYVVRHIQKKYARQPQLVESGPGAAQKNIVMAPKPPQPIPGGIAGPGLLAQTLVSHYVDHLPFHRQERIYGRHGLPFSRQTTDGWSLTLAEGIMQPLYRLMIDEVLQSYAINTDDTHVDVRDAHRKLKYTGRFWPYVGDEEHPLTVFDFTPDRSRDGPAKFLANYRGYLQADAYSAYDGIYRQSQGGIVEVGCWAHARRNFFEARAADELRAHTALAYIRRLYAVERELRTRCKHEWRELRLADRVGRIAADRQERSLPVLQAFHAWLESESPKLLPKHPLHQAMDYALNQWAALIRYAADGRLSIDNLAAERALRSLTIGRRNWLFRGSERGGRAAAVHFSLIASCARHEIEPFAYLRDILTRLPALLPQATPENLRALLPDRWRPTEV